MESATEILRRRMRELALEQINNENKIKAQQDTYCSHQVDFAKKNKTNKKKDKQIKTHDGSQSGASKYQNLRNTKQNYTDFLNPNSQLDNCFYKEKSFNNKNVDVKEVEDIKSPFGIDYNEVLIQNDVSSSIEAKMNPIEKNYHETSVTDIFPSDLFEQALIRDDYYQSRNLEFNNPQQK